MEIYLIRHGDCDRYGLDNYDKEKKTANPKLNEKGYLQVEKLAERCTNIKFDRIYCSDLSRASETAKLFNNTVKSKIIEEPNFREINMGDIYLSSWDNYPELFKKWSKFEEDIPYPNGENGEMVWTRCKKSIEKIIENNFERVAIITHGGAIRSIICGILNIPQERRFFFGYPPENCSISVIKFNAKDSKFYLHTFNDFTHLQF